MTGHFSDYVVVGSGSAGSVIVRRLLDAGATVTVLEAGGPDTNPAIHDPRRVLETWFSADDWQYRTVPRIARSEAEAGDLIFYLSGGSAYHVGIFLGGNRMIAAPHTGTVVRVQDIYSANVAFGRP